ncbi:ectonucleoside triphosphate diphosphohydrolase 5 [Octopus bimaculoides]|uniref:Ectonucleoside triphosphate diphosphohydrolase 5 n=2 Tax=Octopus bimaculoides TaxID=37653 RepID=A0A0L8GC33_OCTBM|nr:ectonucleoside triphosphate diphosphohydrolase 5 [Octopus bimaculoides]XP_014782444.1 ectonucleoside triphosphate diphosphohydrolase 5 [Octopus bimaculoides]XP_014782445.1 ectonucleoside triphosphate diphosphohydrolase 5 [Octopus bimaculoides]|eukprot:XP_014782443.1 PREDICTED: ectonucleoside triphosphate diphosphohydrolase 5-like [Octopus bimaculoides]
MEKTSIIKPSLCNSRRKLSRILNSFSFPMKMWAAGFTVLCVMVVWLSTAYRWNYPSSKEGKYIYGIMFDAGSTGSRIHIFSFSNDNKEKKMILIADIFNEIKPGLSAYASDPKKAAGSLLPLLNLAKSKVPEDLQSSCAIALKATAGLRLLGEQPANNILLEVEKLFKRFPFKMLENNTEIMSGTKEGIYSWLTVNYLLDLLDTPNRTAVALDLGGGSTQITFVPSKPGTLQQVGEDFKESVTLFGQSYNLYTHSYLGLGLMSARFKVSEKVKTTPLQLQSVCIPENTKTSWSFSGDTYQVSSAGNSNFDACYAATSKFVKENMKPVSELTNHHIMAFSYFYDRAVDMNLIGPEGGNVAVNSFQQAAVQG